MNQNYYYYYYHFDYTQLLPLQVFKGSVAMCYRCGGQSHNVYAKFVQDCVYQKFLKSVYF